MTCEKILSNFLDCSIYLSLLFRCFAAATITIINPDDKWMEEAKAASRQGEGKEFSSEDFILRNANQMNIFFIYYVVFIYFTCLLTLLLVFYTLQIDIFRSPSFPIFFLYCILVQSAMPFQTGTARVFKVRDSLNKNLQYINGH